MSAWRRSAAARRNAQDRHPRAPGIPTLPTAWCVAAACLLAAAPARPESRPHPAAEDAALRAAASDELAAFRQTVAAGRERLDRQHDALWDEVRDLREQVRTAEQEQRQAAATRERLQRREAAARTAARSIHATLLEYRRAAEVHLTAAERQHVAPLLLALDEALTENDAGWAGAAGPALTAGLWLAQALAVEALPARRFEGVAYDTSGTALTGRFVTAGPAVYFAGDNPPTVGIVSSDAEGLDPLVLPGASQPHRNALLTLVETGHATVPVDVTDGTLAQLAGADEPLWQTLRKGGIVMVPLLVLGLLGLGVALWRFVALYRMHQAWNSHLDRILDRLRTQRPDLARADVERLRTPWRELLHDAIANRHSGRAYLEETLQERILALSPRVSAQLGTLAVCAAAAPLLGLLGTVTGMIHTFQLITLFGTGDARTLSGGISEALITTQVGLVIAVPALLAHAGLTRMARGVMTHLEQAAARIVRHLTPDEAA